MTYTDTRRTRATLLVKQVAQRLGLYDYLYAHVALAREQRNPVPEFVRRNQRDDRHLNAILAAVLRADSNAIDVGAHSGAFLRSIVRLAPFGHHVAFEPVPVLAARLAKEYPSVEVHAAAAADTVGVAAFQWLQEVPEMSGLRLRDAHAAATEIQVPLRPLDEVVTVPPAFIKIDVEGAEELVLRGARDTLERYRPLVAFEHGRPAAEVFATDSAVVYDLLDAPGLRLFDMDGRGPFSRDEFLEVVHLGEHFNFIAC